MFLLICFIISLLEIKDTIKEKRIKMFVFLISIIIISVFLYLNRNNIESIQTLIEKIKGAINGKN